MEKIKNIKAWANFGDEKFLKSLVEFDENGNETRKEIYFGPDELESKTFSEYNEKGLIVMGFCCRWTTLLWKSQ